MKIVKTGDISRIFSDDLQTYDQLPAGNYKVCFNPDNGFYLEDVDSFEVKEKPYGSHPNKIAKVSSLYNTINRSVGVILSGDKGMGKSMFSQMLSSHFAKENGMPTIIVSEAYRGIVDFIESIKQECIVLFDEFEKVFTNGDKKEHQDKLLSLFDGISQTKRLYVVTVNELRKVNQYMINRPGRFHYHLQFKHPSNDEIELYLKDKLMPQYYNQIALVQRFSNRFLLNYDSLRAIAFELNFGYSFLETMEDLNISSQDNKSVKYNVAIHHSNGVVANKNHYSLDLMSSDANIDYYIKSSKDANDYIYLNFSPLEIEIENKEYFVAYPQFVNINTNFDSDNDDYTNENGISIEKIVFTKVIEASKYGKELVDKF